MAEACATIDTSLMAHGLAQRPITDPSSSMAERMLKRLLAGKSRSTQDASEKSSPLGPVQLPLPLLGGRTERDAAPADAHAPTVELLFREARPVEPVLSYEQASLDQIMPGSDTTPTMPHNRLTLPGGKGLILYEASVGAMAVDWMQWSRKRADAVRAAEADYLGATIEVQELRSRARRRLARHRCIIPLMRYSVPVRDGEMWSHRWMSPAHGPVGCVAGVWSMERGIGNMFAMVTGLEREDAGGPLILAEDELLLWLRAPLNEALSIIAERRTRSETAGQ